MPAPTSSQIAQLARAAFRDADLSGAHADDLAGATADTCGRALAMFLAQAMVLPGIPAAIDPVSGSGSTSGPGKLLPPGTGLGADFDGAGGLASVGFEDVTALPRITERLLAEGFSEKQIAGFWGGNLLRVMRQVEAARE